MATTLIVPLEIWAQKQMLRPKNCRPPLANLEQLARTGNKYVRTTPLELCGMYPMLDLLSQEDVVALAKFVNEMEK